MKTKIILLASLLAAASPAIAQREVNAANANPFTPPPGAFLAPADRNTAEARLRRFAQCVVRGEPALGRALLAAAPSSPEETRLFRKIAVSRSLCMGSGRLAMKSRAMRGALAEQMYLQTYRDPLTEPARPDAPFRPAQGGVQAFHDYGDCIVNRNPAAADAVLRTKPGSTKEKQAYRDTAEALSSCLAGGDSALRIDRLAMRGYLAEALYRHRSG